MVCFRCIIVNNLHKFVVVVAAAAAADDDDDDDDDNGKVIVTVVVVVAGAGAMYRNIQSYKPADRNCTVCASCKSDNSIHISGT